MPEDAPTFDNSDTLKRRLDDIEQTLQDFGAQLAAVGDQTFHPIEQRESQDRQNQEIIALLERIASASEANAGADPYLPR